MGRVVLDRVSKRFGDVAALDDLSLVVDDREFLVLLGPSGCGKSTALRLVAGLEQPTSGTVAIGERVVNGVAAKERDVAMVFQSYALYPHMTVGANVEFPLKRRRLPAAERQARVAEAVRALGLEALVGRKPAQLSGGQRQRVALARAIVRRPQVFLMDEPLSNLDAQLRVDTRAELVELHRRLETTVLYVTHDQVEAMTMGGRIAVLSDGRLQQLGPPQEVYDRPANVFVARFIGSPPTNTVEGDVAAEGEAVRVRVPGGALDVATPTAQVLAARGLRRAVVGVRPEHLALGADGPLAATVRVVESLGHERHVVCALAEGGPTVAVRQGAAGVRPAPGEAVRLRPTGPVHVFDPSTGERVAP